jgi:predicted metal-binding membrane protein
MTAHAVNRRAESRVVPTAAVAAVLGVAAVGWLVLTARMAGMDTGPGGDPGTLGWFAVSWAVMTVAMMLPAAAPAVARLVRVGSGPAPATVVLFLLGYGAVWMLAGLAGYALVQAVRGAHASALGWSSAGRYVAAAAILAAAVYQLTGVKRRWLARCTARDLPSPPGRVTGALRAGVGHGGCCVACCATLMVALYALGMMSLAWMAVLTVLIVGERLLPRPAVATGAVAAVLAVLGLAVAAWPTSLPGLTIPPASHPAMMRMAGPVTGHTTALVTLLWASCERVVSGVDALSEPTQDAAARPVARRRRAQSSGGWRSLSPVAVSQAAACSSRRRSPR